MPKPNQIFTLVETGQKTVLIISSVLEGTKKCDDDRGAISESSEVLTGHFRKPFLLFSLEDFAKTTAILPSIKFACRKQRYH